MLEWRSVYGRHTPDMLMIVGMTRITPSQGVLHTPRVPFEEVTAGGVAYEIAIAPTQDCVFWRESGVEVEDPNPAF